MTKEELKQEAREWIRKNSKEFITNPIYSPFDYAEAIYLAGAEPREKQIQIDAEQIRALQRQNGELTDKVKELEGLIEKYRQAVDKCLHITFMGCGCEVHTIGQYATLVDGYLTDVEGLAKWKD